MRYKAVGQKIFARIDRGEEIISSLCRICAEAGASLADFTNVVSVVFVGNGDLLVNNLVWI